MLPENVEAVWRGGERVVGTDLCHAAAHSRGGLSGICVGPTQERRMIGCPSA
jgi:hypothetical protein